MTRVGSETTHPSETDQIQKSKYDASADADRLVVERVGVIAKRRGVSLVQIALAWFLQKEPVTAPIFGAAKKNHLGEGNYGSLIVVVNTRGNNVPRRIVCTAYISWYYLGVF